MPAPLLALPAPTGTWARVVMAAARAQLAAAARLFRSAPRGALRDDLACPTGVAIQIHRCNLGPLELFCSFFLAGRRFHSVCFLFSFCMHSCTITPSVQHVCMHTVPPPTAWNKP